MSASRIQMRRGLARSPTFSVGWHDAIFEHYRITDEAAVVPWLPDGLELDRHDGTAYISVVSFRMDHMRWRRRWRLPWSHTYPQINVRVYVRSADKFGVVFLRNYVCNRLAAWAGRVLYGVPYCFQNVQLALDGASIECRADLETGVHRVAGVRGPRLTGHENDEESLRFFLVERYPLFTRRGHNTFEAAMLHAPWQLHQLAKPQQTHTCIKDVGLDAAVEPVEEIHTSPGVETLMWPPYSLGSMPALVERGDVPKSLTEMPVRL